MSVEKPESFTKLAAGTVRKTFDFFSRSTRTEVASYYFATLVLGIGFSLVTAMLSLGFESKETIETVGGLFLALPAVALFARRLHDFDRSGWWALLPVAVAVFNIAFQAVARIEGAQVAFEARRAVGYVDYLLIPIVIATLGAILVPGTIGPNRFGPDPRL